MRKKSKALVVAMCALVLALGVNATIAWLTDTTQEVENTFTVGNIDITLAESDSADADTDADKNSYKMVPGHVIAKDPKVTVEAGSENCYVFVEVEKTDDFDKYIAYGVAEGWTELEEGVYYRRVAMSDADQTFSVLAGDKVTVKPGVTKSDMDVLEVEGATLPQMNFKAYAIQQSSGSQDFAPATAWQQLTGLNAQP